MPIVDSAGVKIAYEAAGSGRPIVLVHGFAADRKLNWKLPGVFDALTAVGRRVVALDCRGHGESDKLYDPEAYRPDRMAGDVLRLMDHLELERVDLMGYSMGAMISVHLLERHTERLDSVVLGGIGASIFEERGGSAAIVTALEWDDPTSVSDPVARAFRAFADRPGVDLRALAACMSRIRTPADPARLAKLALPVLVIAGENDVLVGDPAKLAAAIPGAKLVVIPGREHLNAPADRRYREAVIEFLGD